MRSTFLVPGTPSRLLNPVRLPNYTPTSSDRAEVLRYGIGGGAGTMAGRGGKITSVIGSTLRSAGKPSSYTSTRIDMDFYPYWDDARMWRAYGGVRIDFSSPSIAYRRPRRNAPEFFYGQFSISLFDTYAWPSEFSAFFSRTYDAAKYLEDNCGFVPMDHEMHLTKRY